VSSKTRTRRLVVAHLVLAAAVIVPAAVGAAPATPIAVVGAWIRPVQVGMNGAGYMTLVNRGGLADRLIGASSPVAAQVSVHRSLEIGGVMTMRAIPVLDVAGGARVSLAPGGLHLMLEGLRRPLAPGQRVPVTLIFAKAGRVRITLVVRVGAPAMPGMAM
jgi:copper(I)-binding protein